MSDHDFDAYLSLLTRFLRLSSRQREEIRRELRAHLDEALDDYVAQGFSRQEAALRALEDFGDAAELAARFRAIGRTRRWLMRGTATAAGIGIVALTATYFAPQSVTTVRAGLQPVGLMQAAEPHAGGAAENAVRGANEGDDAANAAVVAALRQRSPEFNFAEVPLESVFDFITDLTQINVVVQWGALDGAGIPRDRPVTLRLRDVSTEQMLNIVLADVGHGAVPVSHQVEHGILIISTTEALKRNLVTQVYDVRDLLTAGMDWQKTKEQALARFGATPPPAAPAASPPPAASSGSVSEPVLKDCATAALETTTWPEDALVQLIMDTVQSDDWQANGGMGTVSVYNGILVVRQHAAGHEALQKLLLMLRDAGAARAMEDGVAAR